LMRYTSDIPRDSLLSLLAAPAMAIEDIFHDARRDAHVEGCGKNQLANECLELSHA
jgi:hypothetical protein